jgi:chromosome segregation ATPase
MLTRLATVTFVAVISLSPPQQSQQDEIASLKRQVQELRDQQAEMQRDLTAIKNLLQTLLQPRGAASPEVAGSSARRSRPPTSRRWVLRPRRSR